MPSRPVKSSKRAAGAKFRKTQDLQNARFMALNREATSQVSSACVSDFVRVIVDWETRTNKRKRDRGPLQRAALEACVAAIVADLLMAQARGQSQRWSYRALRPAEFTGEAVSYRVFKSVYDALKAMEMLEVMPGFLDNTFQEDWAPGIAKHGKGAATRMRPTAKFLRVTNKHQIAPDTISEHFVAQAPRVLLELKGERPKNGSNKAKPERLSFDETPKSKAIWQRVADINAFWTNHKLTGGEHLGYKRTFSQGHLPNYQWNKGGRLYSFGGDSYQQLPKAQRLKMMIDGEPVVELDVRASYLAVLHGLLGIPFNSAIDPYTSDRFDRRVVKKFVTVTLGKGAYPTRWSPETKADLAEQGVTIFPSLKTIKDDVLARSEAMRRWPTCGLDVHDLMYCEAEAMIQVIETLADEKFGSIPSLSVHDSIIVPQSKWQTAAWSMEGSFYGKCRVMPCIVKHADGREPEVLPRQS